MILNDTDIKNLLVRNTSDGPIRGYAIRLDGRIFRTDKGKIFWQKKHYAMAALRNTFEYRLKRAVLTKLYSQGHTTGEIYRDSEYTRAYDNFLSYLENNNLIQIVKVG